MAGTQWEGGFEVLPLQRNWMNLLPTDFYFFSSLFLCCCSQSTAGGQQAIYCRHGFGRTHSGLCFYRYSFLYLFVKELYCSVVWSPLGRASISASYSIFFGNLNLQLLTQFWPWQPSQHQNYCHYFLKNHLISTAKNWGGALLGPRRKAIPSPAFKAWFCGRC
jgi:hypothetical protein